jgi:glyoxylase-like metal-dependent hydrolase (beta-lactamase superfamily II)
MMRGLVAMLLALHATLACALEVRFERVADNVYAYVGDTGGRTVHNQGLNANLGLVVTRDGALLIDSGSTAQVARAIEEAVRRVTPQPVRWVINTGTQDHRWLGNGWFAARGAETIAHAAALPDMRARGGDQLAALRTLLGAAADGTEALLPRRTVGGADTPLLLGGTRLTLVHRGGGHTPGDIMVWLPDSGVLFAGDIVYVDRLLAVIPVSHTGRWLEAFAALEALAPRVIVPGHGRVTDLSVAREQTRDYLAALRAHARRAVDAGQDPSSAARSFDASRWSGLINAAELGRGNASRVYLEVERE